MRLHFAGPRTLVCLLLLLPASLAFAQNVIVDCSGATAGAFTSLNSAINGSPDKTAFLVSGTCIENVSIGGRNRLTFFGNPTATIQAADPNSPILSMAESQGIQFLSMTFSGGQGILMLAAKNVVLTGIIVKNSTVFGIESANSSVQVQSSSITANTRSGIVVSGGSFELDGGVTVSNNGRFGISAGATHLTMSDGSGPNIISDNGLSGIQLFDTSQADFTGDNEITNNNTTNATGQFGFLVLANSGLNMSDGIINSNAGTGVICDLHSQCSFANTHIDANTAGGMQVLEHSLASFTGVDVSNNTGTGVLVDQGSSLSLGGDTIANNTGDGLILNTLSTLKFFANDVMTASPGNLTLNCNNGSIVDGDVSIYKPKKCGAQFQAGPLH
jgi:Right handed beta helix region